MNIILCCSFFLLSLVACNASVNRSSKGEGLTDSIKDTDSVNRDNSSQTVVSSDRIIAPGKLIGKTRIGENAEMLSKTLGKPDMSDAAMGKAWLTWYGKKRDEHNNRTELNIYTTYKDSTMATKVVKQIRTTSSWFMVRDSLHVYSDFAGIQSVFPNLQYVGKYQDDTRVIKLYDDARQGIAFEVVSANKQRICTGIIVHVPGKSVAATYIPLNEHRIPE